MRASSASNGGKGTISERASATKATRRRSASAAIAARHAKSAVQRMDDGNCSDDGEAAMPALPGTPERGRGKRTRRGSARYLSDALGSDEDEDGAALLDVGGVKERDGGDSGSDYEEARLQRPPGARHQGAQHGPARALAAAQVPLRVRCAGVARGGHSVLQRGQAHPGRRVQPAH